MLRDFADTFVGLVVLVLLVSLCIGLYKYPGLTSGNVGETYAVNAVFADTSGLSVGKQVKISGVPVGSVSSIVLADNYLVHVALQIVKGVRIPEDSSAAIANDGLMGDSSIYVRIDPGASDDYLSDGGLIQITQQSLTFDRIVRGIFSHFMSGDNKQSND